jgi:tetratricopeptide (TPR) repeat protein
MTTRVFPVVLLVGSCGFFMVSAAQSVSPTTPSRNKSIPDRQATISAAELRVSGKARDAYRKAWFAMSENKLSDAARYIEKALSVCPQYAAALVLRATLEMQDTNSHERAKDDAEKAIEYDPNYAEAYIVLGSAFNSLGQFDDAIRTLDRGIVLLPASWQGHYEMSYALWGKRDFLGGLHQAERASSLGAGNYPDLHLVKAYCYEGLKNGSAAATDEREAFRSLGLRNPVLSEARQWAPTGQLDGR